MVKCKQNAVFVGGAGPQATKRKKTKQTQFRTTRLQSMGYDLFPVRRVSGSANAHPSLHPGHEETST